MEKAKAAVGKWFHPKTLLDKTYEIGLFIKGFDGTVELIAAVLLVVVPTSAIERITRTLAGPNPHNLITHQIAHTGAELAKGHNLFAILFFATHGAAKVALVIALLRQKLWAYPWALVILVLFLVYQAYLLITKPTFGMAFLMVLDVIIIWLVWREWQKVKLPAEAKD